MRKKTNNETITKNYDAYLLLFESETVREDDIWIGIYTNVNQLIKDYQESLKNVEINMPIQVYGFHLNTVTDEPKKLHIKNLKLDSFCEIN